MKNDEAIRRDNYYKRYYGISLKDYERLLKKQKNKCGCCGRHAHTFAKRLSVDHDHTTGEIRGLLCIHCNRYIIGRHRTPEIFKGAAKYLTGPHTGLFVPEKYIKGKPRRRKKSQSNVF